ncbi:hypothetical protein ONJ23_26610 [Salmonella enterica subsp. enterica serovar Virginia]|nr:hypothetical protein [Salmonella enterica subsp. enterica serovar Virginia]
MRTSFFALALRSEAAMDALLQLKGIVFKFLAGWRFAYPAYA